MRSGSCPPPSPTDVAGPSPRRLREGPGSVRVEGPSNRTLTKPVLGPSWSRLALILGPSWDFHGRSCGLPRALGLFQNGLGGLQEGPKRAPRRLREGPGSVRFEGPSKRTLPNRRTGRDNQRTKGPKDQRTKGPKDQRTKGPEDQRTKGPKDQRIGGTTRRTKGPEDQRTKGPKDQRIGGTTRRTKGPKDQRTKGPKDQRTKGPEDQRTKGPEDQRTKGSKDRRIGGTTGGPKDQRTKGPKDTVPPRTIVKISKPTQFERSNVRPL